MATVKTLIGNVKGPKGDTGETGATGVAGAAATIQAGTADTVAYGQPAEVTNVGTSSAAIFNFKIPAGAPGTVGEISGYPVNAITTQQGNFPMPLVGETIAQIVGKQAKATADAQTGIQTANTNIANILGDFGTVEPAATASKAYAVGDYLVLNGQFYKVTAAIAQGNALTVGGNIEPTNVGAEVTALKSDLSKYVKLDNTNPIRINNVAELQNHLTTIFDSMNNGDLKYRRIYAAYAGSLTNGGTAACLFNRSSDTVKLVFCPFSLKYGQLVGSTWSWYAATVAPF